MLRQSLTYQLASIADDAIGQASLVFKRRFGLDVHELRVLRLIDDEPGISFTDLAKKTRFERSATSRILSRLVKNGLAKRKIDGDDARRFLFFSTAKARALRADVDPISLELEALVLSPLREEERRQFLTVLNKIADWLKGDAALKEMQRLYPDSRPADKTPAANRGKRPRGETAAS